MSFLFAMFAIHDNVCNLIHKTCHQKSYDNGIIYHIKLYTIFSVVFFLFKIWLYPFPRVLILS